MEQLYKKALEAQKQNLCENELTRTWFMPLLRRAGWDTETITDKYMVRTEKVGPQGRVDVALTVGGRVVVCIEVKRPSEKTEDHLEQALKYGSGYYYPRNGVLDPILTIATNGITAYLIDCSIQHPLFSGNLCKIDLTNEDGVKRLVGYLSKNEMKEDGSVPWVKTRRIVSREPFASNGTRQLLAVVLEMVQTLKKKGYSKERSVELSVVCLLLAAARDNGIVPNAVILENQDKKNWKKLRDHLEDVFGDVFADVASKEIEDFWELYAPTQELPVRLDILPVEYIGLIYEKLLRDSGDSSTSYYTPKEMIDMIIEYVNPSVTDTILDPTCGSGAFLSSAVQYAVEKEIRQNGEITDQRIRAFITEVLGVDKDKTACRIAKVTLLATFMRLVGEKYRHSGKSLPKPKIADPIDFFDWDDCAATVIIGNPPWGSVDKLSKERKAQFKRMYEVYAKSNDQLCYVVEKAISRHLATGGRFGFVIKQQSLNAASYLEFVRFLNHKVERIVDFGDQMLFSNMAQSAIILGNQRYKGTKWSITRIDPKKIAVPKGESVAFAERYDATRGAECACGPVYKAFARDYPKHKCVRQHPTDLGFGVAERLVPMAYIRGANVPREFMTWLKQHPEHEASLLNRQDVQDSGRDPYAWRRDNSERLRGHILITERNLKPERGVFPFLIDYESKFVATDGQTCIASRSGTLKDVQVFAALLVSDFFIPLCRYLHITSRRSEGIFLSPSELEKLILPRLTDADSVTLAHIINSVPLSEESTRAINRVLSPYFTVDLEKESEHLLYSKKDMVQHFYPHKTEKERKVG